MPAERSASHAASRPATSPSAASAAILFCCIVAFLDGADTQALAIAAPLIARQLGIGPAFLGWVFSAALLGAALGAIACGTLADRFGAKRMLVLCTAWFGCFQLATARAESWDALLVLRFFAGLGLGGATPSFLALAAAQVAPERRARILGVIWGFFPIGGFVGGFVNGALVQDGRWPMVFVLGGVMPLVTALCLALLVRERGGEASGPGEPSTSTRSLAGLLVRDRTLRWRTLLLCCVYVGAFGTLAGIVVWLPTMLVRAGFPPIEGGRILSWHALGALVSMSSAGFLLERLGPRLLGVGIGVSAVMLALLGAALGSLPTVALLMVLLGITLGLAASGAVALSGSVFPADVRSSGMGWTMGAGRLGQMILPLLMGFGLGAGLTPATILAASAILPALTTVAAVLLAHSLSRGEVA